MSLANDLRSLARRLCPEPTDLDAGDRDVLASVVTVLEGLGVSLGHGRLEPDDGTFSSSAGTIQGSFVESSGVFANRSGAPCPSLS